MNPLHTGKVRELYELDDAHLLMVASDRISAFDWVLSPEIPDKGRVLTALSVWWFDRLADIVAHHLVSPADPRIPPQWRGRALVVRRLRMLPVECVARGYLSGSGWADYQRAGTVSGVALPAGLREGDRLPEPVFTPTAKGALGEHDEPMTYEEVAALVGADTAAQLRRLTLEVYRRGAALAGERGLVLADTKFEFGVDPDGRLVLADEVLTPDSSRYWPADGWRPGGAQPSYDKQYVRDWLRERWDPRGSTPPPPLPEPVVAATRARYVECYERVTGESFAGWLQRFAADEPLA